MKKYTFYPLIFAFIFLSNISNGQVTKAEVEAMILESNESQLVNHSSRMLQENHYYFSSLVTDKLLELNPESANYNYRKGFILLGLSCDFENAMKHLLKAKDNISKNFDMYSVKETGAPADVLYHLGRCYHLNEQYDEAKKYFNDFVSISNKESELIKEAQLRIVQCDVAINLTKAPKDVKITNIEDVNTENGEYSTYLSVDGKALYFTARKPWENNETESLRDLLLYNYPEDIYMVIIDENGHWGAPKRLDHCKPEINEASVSVSHDEREIFLYEDTTGFGDIYTTKYKDREYKPSSAIQIDGVNTEEGWETHLTVSADGNTVYFVSDREGGYGKRDIYTCEKVNGKWGKPVNMGPMINSEYDEESPFMGLDNNTLYFSCNGPKSMGEFDIFSVSKDENGMWMEPVNLGYPINSPGQDLFYTSNYDARYAFITSIRKGGKGDKDVYMIDNKTSNADGLAFLNGKIINTNGNDIPEGSYISLKCIDCDDNSEEVIMPRVRDGAFVSLLEKCKEYEITYYYEEGSKDPYTETFNTDCDIAFEEVNKTVLLVEEDKIIIPIFTYDLAGIVSDRSSNETITGATVEIFNKAGDTVELWSTDENGGFNSNLADGLVLNDKLDYNVKVKSIGYITQEFELNNVLGKDSIITVSYLIEKDTVETDLAKVLNLKPIYFDFDKSNIRDDAKVELDKVIAALNDNPNIKVECGAHTDCRGPKGYNRGLSERRAKSTAKYIKKKISNPERVTFKGYGESQPATDCSCKKCSTEQHQLNRRTEFIIID
ncbi:MAG: hypothetical protein CL824_01190 [Crocinitomicaceae bacterium]|nr:hypothetical protein [Crocinitomicaceae bacterium]